MQELTEAQGKRLRPALLLDEPAGRTLVFDMDRDGDGRKTLAGR